MDKELTKSYRYRKWFTKGLWSLSGLLGVFLALWGFNTLIHKPLEASKLITATVQNGLIENAITASGVVKPSSELTLTSPMNTRIERLLVQRGAIVRPGEKLMLLDTEFAKLEYQQLEDELRLKKNNVTRMKLELEKNLREIELEDQIMDLEVQNLEALLTDVLRLLQIGGTTQEEVDKARQNLEIARLQKQKLENELEYRKASMDHDILNEKIQLSIQVSRLTEIKKKIELASVQSPTAGVITWMDDHIGNQVGEGSPLVRIANLNAYKIEGQVSDIHAGKIDLGLPVQIRAGNQILTGTIAQVLPAVENKAIQFRISLEDPEFEILRPQMEVDLRIVVGVKGAGLFIPNSPAIRPGRSQKLFVIRGNEAIAKHVETGMRTLERVEITDGLVEGEMVILSDMSTYERRNKIRLK